MAEFSTENSYLSTIAWFSRNGPNGQFHNETIAQPLVKHTAEPLRDFQIYNFNQLFKKAFKAYLEKVAIILLARS